jgi:hypothetical protein
MSMPSKETRRLDVDQNLVTAERTLGPIRVSDEFFV